MGSGPRPKPHPKKTHGLNIKLWESDLELWQKGEGPKPGPHPVDDHNFNKMPELYDIV